MHRLLPWLGLATLLVAAPALAQHSHMGHGAGGAAAAPTFQRIGNVHHEIATTSKDAQRWFDQGLFLCYGFNHAEAIRAFQQSAKADPKCAMAWWGIALANGPNINWPMDSTQEANAYQALQKARALAAKSKSLKERDYIAALAKRYAKTPGQARAEHDSAYARAMKDLSHKYPDDLDAATLYAESMLDLNPWNQWTLHHEARPGTMEIVEVLESVLKRNPDHVGAIHYYIHTVEAGPLVDRAVPYTERLSKMDLDAGHLVHMPSHIFQRIGRYEESEKDNIEASDLDSVYAGEWKPQGLYPMMYIPHNIHFTWAAAQMAGRSAQAIRYARRLTAMVSADMVAMMPPMEFWSPTVTYALVRFQRWDEMLAEPAPDPRLSFTTGIWHFGRGEAFAGKGDYDKAAVERDSVLAIAARTPMEAVVSFNAAKSLLTIAANQLSGTLWARKGNMEEATKSFVAAMAVEDTLHYDEPPAWALPVRQSFGNALLAAGRARESEFLFRQDLARNPENGWSLYGLAQALRGRNAMKDVAEFEGRYKIAWARADVTLPLESSGNTVSK